MEDITITRALVLSDIIDRYMGDIHKWWEQPPSSFNYPRNYNYGRIMVKTYRTPKHSCLPGIQAFTYIGSNYINLPRMSGGRKKIIDQAFNEPFSFMYQSKEYIAVSKTNVAGVYQSGQYIIIMPKKEYEESDPGFRYVYLSTREIELLARGVITPTVQQRCSNIST
ncbi:MAG: hypothetical protein Pg6A_19830 [Termitinemataceae bacterium]|nr:MAG: hypothetical protein Pg6A_19830 [Termitinemataceae bacterium]